MFHLKKTLFIVALLGVHFSLHAAISYDAELDAIRVTDFPKYYPCTIERLVDIDRYFGWGKVKYDQDNRVCTVNCNLIIGNNDGTDTYFQLGSVESPQETLVMAGNLYMHPYFINGEHPPKYKYWWYYPKKVNRLTLGIETDSKVKAALKFACAPGKAYSLYTGVVPGVDNAKKRCRGGQIVMYNSILTALSSEKNNEIPSLTLRGDGFVLENSEISRVKNMMTYGTGLGWKVNYKIKNSIFADGGTALVCGKQQVSGCTFRNCGTAVLDYGSFEVELTDCIFENNLTNFCLRFPAKKQSSVTCIDCTFGKPKQGDKFALLRPPKTGYKLPEFISKRHMIIEVVDEAGKAVKGATVNIKPEQLGFDILETRAVTGKNGKTAAKGDRNAILLTEVIKQCRMDSKEPKTTELSYSLSASSKGKSGTLTKIKPDQSWKTLKIIIK